MYLGKNYLESIEESVIMLQWRNGRRRGLKIPFSKESEGSTPSCSTRKDTMKDTKLAPVPKSVKDLQKYYGIQYKGKWNMYLNWMLAVRQKVTVGDLKTLVKLHLERLELFDRMAKEDSRAKLRKQAKELEKLEFAMQEAWKFEKSANFHTWWYHAPQCNCPRMDNEDRFGTKYRIIREDCPVHGKVKKGKKEKVTA